jgi:hypothetical protein
MPNPFLIMGALKGAYDWYEGNRERKKIEGTISELRSQLERDRSFTASSNRGAYSNALAFMSANRNDPNAWRFASGSYAGEISGNQERLNRREAETSQQITGLEMTMPDNSLQTLWGDITMGGLNSYLFGKFAGVDKEATGDWSFGNLWKHMAFWNKGDMYYVPRPKE